MENLIFCLNATVPIFILMILGFFFMKIGIFTESFTKTMNSFVFKVALPVLVFQDLSQEDFVAVWDGKYVLFCFLVTLLSITLVSAVVSVVFVSCSATAGETGASSVVFGVFSLGVSLISSGISSIFKLCESILPSFIICFFSFLP